MSLLNTAKEYDQIRKCNIRKDRIIQSFLISKKIYDLLSQSNEIPPFGIDGGTGLVYVIYVKMKFENNEYSTQHIIDLLKIYCKTTHHFIGNIARQQLCSVFKIPSPCRFDDKDVYSIYKYLKHELPLTIPKSELNRHIDFCEILSIFFMMYSNKIYKGYTETDYGDVDKLFRASLLGQATGDALGFLVEGQPRFIAEEYVRDVVTTESFSRYGLNRIVGSGGYPRYTSNLQDCLFKLGQYTDDTQLCRELIKSIAKYGDLNVHDFGDRLVTLFGKSGLLREDTLAPPNHLNLNIETGIVGYGKTTLFTTQCIADGAPWEQTGTLIKSQGNGGCMRAAPLGVLYFEQPWKLKEVASLQSIGTHGSSRCRATSVMVAEAARLACESVVYPWSVHIVRYPVIFCDRLSLQVRSIDVGLTKVIKLIPGWLEETDEVRLVSIITKKGKELGDSLWHEGAVISASAVQTALFAVVCFLRHPDSYKNAVSMAIRAGGDTDTVAAICGAISAARTGSVLDVNVNDRGLFGIDYFNILAHEARVSIR